MNDKSSVRDRSSPQVRDDLASLIEQAIRGPAVISKPVREAPQDRRASPAAPQGTADSLPNRLIEELSAAQEQYRPEPPPAATEQPPVAAEPEPAVADTLSLVTAAFAADPAGSGMADSAAAPAGAPASIPAAASVFDAAAARAHARAAAPADALNSLADLEEAAVQEAVLAPGLSGMLAGCWARYQAVLSIAHRRIFDQRIERLLFFKTPAPHSWLRTAPNGQKKFRYQSPIPQMALGWALSTLPADLKRYAFVDFEAGNGRTLLLAARRNFEHAIGYTHDGEACATLEMNLAQYSRSYMTCRDVRALSASRDELPIPMQPAVLFFPDNLGDKLGAVLSQLAASLRQKPRTVYLIFENSGPERELKEMRMFRTIRLPFLNRVKTMLFSPARIAVYKSLNNGAAH